MTRHQVERAEDGALKLLSDVEYGTWKGPFLAALSEIPNVTRACHVASISKRWAYKVRKEDPEFAQQWAEALDESLDALEMRVFEAAEGGDWRAAESLLKAHRPQRWANSVKVQQNLILNQRNEFSSAIEANRERFLKYGRSLGLSDADIEESIESFRAEIESGEFDDQITSE